MIDLIIELILLATILYQHHIIIKYEKNIDNAVKELNDILNKGKYE